MNKWFVLSVFVGFSLFAIPTSHSQSSTPDQHTIQIIERSYVGVFNLSSTEDFAMNADGSQIAAASSETTVNVWDIATGDIIHTFDISTCSVAWSPNGQLIAASTRNDDVIGIWDAGTGDLVRNLFGSPDCYGSGSISWSPDSSRIVLACGEILDAQTGELLSRLGQRWSLPNQVVWSPDGTMIATAGGFELEFIQLFLADGTRFDTYWGNSFVAWSPDSTHIASTAQIRAVDSGVPVSILPDMENGLAWHPDGEWIASTTADGDIFLWDVVTGDLVTAWHYDGCLITGLIWSGNGERFAFSCGQTEPEVTNDLVIGELVR